MANRSYLYSLSNQPSAYSDRPETISGLSEWPYLVPFVYKLLMSGNPQLCASLVSDGYDDEPANSKTKLYAIGSDFEIGFARLNKFFSILRAMGIDKHPVNSEGMAEAIEFLEAHRDRYLLLETIELDTMFEIEETRLRAMVEAMIEHCTRVGIAVDALPDNVVEAGEVLKKAAQQQMTGELDVFYGLRFDEACDDADSDYPMGLSYWSDCLYFSLWSRAEFEANRH